MEFNVNEYWMRRGRNYVHENLPQEFHRLQEKFLIDILRASQISLASILEIGCGFGRITRLLAELSSDTKIIALDLSPEQLENARKYCAGKANVTFQQYDLYSDEPFPGDNYDAAVAIEVFLHHPRPVVLKLFQKLAKVCGHLINIDWSEEWLWKTAEHVWVHDYRALYQEMGFECATFSLPEKVDGKQQKLFIASKKISPTIRNLEKQWADSLGAGPLDTSLNSPGASNAIAWPYEMSVAIEEIRKTLPAGSTFILVNDDQWGNESRAFAGYRSLPFTERNGNYWGPPDNDSTAVTELQRLQRMGASHIVFAWNSFWWLDHYHSLNQRLYQKGALLLDNERVKIFQLPNCA
jgi:SAM-dependent methyltransferase